MTATSFVRARVNEPFELHRPNALTAQTLAKSERGEDVHHAKNADDLFEQLAQEFETHPDFAQCRETVTAFDMCSSDGLEQT